MTNRQWELYNLLMANPNKWFEQEEICEKIADYTLFNRKNDKCPQIREDKIQINASDEVEKIIVMKNYKFKIGTYEEYKEERRKHIKRLKNQVAEIQHMDYKYKHDEQGKLLNEQGKPYEDKDKENRFYESFIREQL